jgi:hypothetical protein
VIPKAAEVSVLFVRINVTAITFRNVSLDQNGALTTGPSIVGVIKTDQRTDQPRTGRRASVHATQAFEKDEQEKQVTVE